MSKAMKQTLAALKGNQAVVLGREAPAKVPAGAVLLTFGKSFALQPEATVPVEALPPKLAAAAKVVANTGGVVTSAVAKSAGVDFAALLSKLQANKNVTVTLKGARKFSVTPKAKRADLLQVGQEPAAPAAKASKSAKATTPVKAAPKAGAKASKKPKEAAKPAKATKVAKAPAKAAPKASKAAVKAAPAKGKAAKAAKPAAKAAKAAPKAKAKEAPAKPAKKAPAKAAKDSKPAKAAKKETKPAKKGKGKGKK
jgi:hypothetical protein